MASFVPPPLPRLIVGSAATSTTTTSTATRKPQQRPLHHHDSVTAAATIFSSRELAVERVMPGIYLTKNFTAWNESNLRAHGFTHVIIIDKHIQELYYPSPVFKLVTAMDAQRNVSQADTYDGFDYICKSTTLSFGKEFEALDLNFGEKSYLTTVLPNCYRAVKFINKSLQAGGTILVIDCNAGEQKCVTIVIAFLMYKHNISFNIAFGRLKEFYNKANLDRFYMSQLYEYEPILQVQRAQARGHSCSRELHSAILKRKQRADDDVAQCTNEFFVNLKPLSQFNASHTKVQDEHAALGQQHVAIATRKQQAQESLQHNKLADKYRNADQQISMTDYQHHVWNDYAME